MKMIAWGFLLSVLFIVYMSFLIIGMGRSIIQRINILENEVLKELKLMQQQLGEKLNYTK